VLAKELTVGRPTDRAAVERLPERMPRPVAR
jgi:hypothetical protein